MYRIKDKWALITGAGNRLGQLIAASLVQAGAHIIVHYNQDCAGARDIVDFAVNKGRSAFSLQADFSQTGNVSKFLSDLGQSTIQKGIVVDILINSASIYQASRINSVSLAEIESAFRVNSFAPMELSQWIARYSTDGIICNVLDNRMVDYDWEHVAYSLAKRTLFSITRMMSLELAPRIRVNGVAPGYIDFQSENSSFIRPRRPCGHAGQGEKTDAEKTGREPNHDIEKILTATPLHRCAQAREVIDALMFLCRSRSITGQVIFVDGGRHLKGNVFGI